MVVLRGSIAMLIFDETGRIERVVRAGAGSGCIGIDLQPGVYHSFLATSPDTVLFEVKSGPYDAATDKQFAEWAPEEGGPDDAAYLRGLEDAVARFGA